MITPRDFIRPKDEAQGIRQENAIIITNRLIRPGNFVFFADQKSNK